MTLQSPRIYIYKITFEEVPYYYYGVHKEKKFGEEYWGSPVTHKWVWYFYTPKKQILEIFPFTDECWLEAQEVEKRIIKSVYNADKWCLNENYGGIISLDILRKSGKKTYGEQKGIFSLTPEERREISRKTGKKNVEENRGIFSLSFDEKSEHSKKIGEKLYKEKKGIHARTEEEMREQGRKNGLKTKDEGKGIFSITPEERIDINRKVAQKLYEEGKGIFSLTPEERSKNSKKTALKRWKCTITGFTSNACGLSRYQKKRNIDTSNRICIT